MEIVLTPMKATFSPPPKTPDEALALEEYADALKGFDRRDLETGWRGARNAHMRDFWPPIGILVKSCQDARRNRVALTPQKDVLHGRIVDGRFQPWGGACQCDRCVDKKPTEGFYRAPKDMHEKDAQLHADLDAHFKRKYEERR